MLGHDHAGGGAQEGDGGGNVERAQAIAAGADHIEDFAAARGGVQRWREGFLAQGGGERGDFRRRLAFVRQRHEEIRLHLGRHPFIRQTFDGSARLLRRQGLRGGKLFGEGIQHGAILRRGAKGTN